MGKRILITGAVGMLGKDITEVFRKDKEYDVFAIFRKSAAKKRGVHYIGLDLRKLGELKRELRRIKPDIIIHCAALVDVDYCEKHKNEADILHYRVTDILSSYDAPKTKFIYISTDSVFDGIKGNYTEKDTTHPLNYYARSKLKGERAAIANNRNSLVIRTNIFGFHIPRGHSLVEWALDNLLKKKRIGGFTDVFFNPVYTGQLSRIVKFIVDDNCALNGILNIGSDERINKYIFLTKLAGAFKERTELVDSVSVDSIFFRAKRPRDTSLDIGGLRRIIKKIPNLDDGLEELRRDYRSFVKNANP